MARIFISHSSKNNAEAIAVGDWLREQGWADIFLDLDPERGLKAGERWQEALKRAAARCELVIFLVSPAWADSKWCLAEFLLAKQLNKRIFGVVIDPTPFERLPTEMTSEWQLVDLAAGERSHTVTVAPPPGDQQVTVAFADDGLNRLRLGLQQAGLDASYFAWPPEDDPKRPPYRGLRPLEAEDAGIFFGRDGSIVTALDRLRGLREAAPPRFVAILGASGAGKSSFLRAGLLPRLARDDRHFRVLPVLRPDRAAISGPTGLVAALTEALEGATQAAIRDAVASGAETVKPLLARLAEPTLAEATAPTLILPIDQGEELFRSDGADEARALLSLLRDLLADDGPAITALIAIRSDAYEPLQTAPELEGVAQQTFSLPPMPMGEYASVIEGPARRLAGSDRALEIEQPLTQALLHDIEEGGAKDALPLLAFTLERLYREHGGDGDLKLSEYQQMGRIRGSIDAAVEEALAAADADPAIPKDRAARLALLRRGLIPWLAGIDPDTGAPRRRVARVSEIPVESRPLIDLLVEKRLLSVDRPSRRDGETGELVFEEETIEPAHEALLRQWGVLEGWLEEDFETLATAEGVKRAARDWDANARDAEWLDHAGGRLDAAEAVMNRADLKKLFEATDRAYLAAAQQAETERRETERARQARELAQARRLVRRTAAGLFASLILATGAAYFGWQAKTAEKDAESKLQVAQIAESRFLSRLALQQVSGPRGNGVAAIMVALAGLPDMAPGPHGLPSRVRPHVPEAELSLFSALLGSTERMVLTGHSNRIYSAAFSPDGKKVVTGSLDNTARIWDARTGAKLTILNGHGSYIDSVAFSPDGKKVVTGSNDGTARIWDAASGATILRLEGHKNAVRSVAFSPNGTQILTGSEDGTAQLWNAATGARSTLLSGHEGGVNEAVFSRDGSSIVTASEDATARVWDAATGKELLRFRGHSGRVLSAAFSPDGRQIVTGSADNLAKLWNAEDGRDVSTFQGHTRDVNSVGFSPDGTRVVTASDDETARLWNRKDGSELIQLEGHKGVLSSAVFSSDGSRVVTGGWDNTARIWNVDRRRELAKIVGPGGPVMGAAFSLDGTRFVSTSKAGVTQVWDAATRSELFRHEGNSGSFQSASISQNGEQVAISSNSNDIELFNVSTGGKFNHLKGHADTVADLTFSPDGARLASLDRSGNLKIWDIEKSRNLFTIESTGYSTYSGSDVQFSPDGKQIITSGEPPEIWNAETGRKIIDLKSQHRLSSFDFTADGSRIAGSHSGYGAVYIFDAVNGEKLFEITRFGGLPESISISRKGDRLAIGTRGEATNTVRIFDVKQAREVAVLEGHGGPITSLHFNRDTSKIVSASDDGTIRVWKVFPTVQALIDEAKHRVPRCIPPEDLRSLYLPVEPPRWCVTGPGLEDELDPQKWAPKWPYMDVEWREWLAAIDRGEKRLTPHEAGPLLMALEKTSGEARDEGRFEDALLALDEAVALSPATATLRASRAAIRASLGDRTAASEDLAKAGVLEYSGAASQFTREIFQIAYRSLKKDAADQALSTLDNAIAVISNAANLHLLRAVVHASRRDAVRARDDLAKAQSLGYEGAVAEFERLTLKLVDRRIGEKSFETALEFIDSAVAVVPTIKDLYLRGAAARLRMGKIYEAREDITKARELGLTEEVSIVSQKWWWPKAREEYRATESYELIERFIDQFFSRDDSEYFAYRVATLHRRMAGGGRSVVTRCDELASFEGDPFAVAEERELAGSNVDEAIDQCSKLIEANEGDAIRYRFNRSRAFWKAAQAAIERGDTELGAALQAKELADLLAAQAVEYVAAFDHLAYNYEYAWGVAEDKERSKELINVYVNSVVACCWTTVARQVLDESDPEMSEVVKAIVAELTDWAVALGGMGALDLRDALQAEGRLEPRLSAPQPASSSMKDTPPWLR